MEWISVKDKLPEEGQRVLCYRPKAHEDPSFDQNYRILTFNPRVALYDENGFEGSHEVSHWMPLPPPPVVASE